MDKTQIFIMSEKGTIIKQYKNDTVIKELLLEQKFN